MSTPLPDGRPVRIVIRRLAIGGTSSIDARRLADGIAPAIERALRRADESVTHADRPRLARPVRPADLAADAIAAAIADRLSQGEAAS